MRPHRMSFVLNLSPGWASNLERHVGAKLIHILDGEILQTVEERRYANGQGGIFPMQP